METSRLLYRLISHLLQYPDNEWRKRLPAIRTESESITDIEVKRKLTEFLDQAEKCDPLEWQSLYVKTFDFGKRTNLYLTYAEFGEERERGRALIELKRRYAEAGFDLESNELPDYLPLVLEFASAAPWDAAQAVLSGRRDAIASIRNELTSSGSPYAPLLDLVLTNIPGDVSEQAEVTPLGRVVR
jgi:nitrate reductase delta subunit